jgi:hypothetical protein
MYFDLLKTGNEFNVAMPYYLSMQKYVRNPAVLQNI